MPSPAYQAVSHSSGTATSFTATEPTGTTSGDGLLLLVFLDTAPSGWTPPSGWVEKGATGGTTVTGGGQTFQAYIYAIERGGSAPALGGSWTGSHYFEWTVIRVSGQLTGGSAAFVESVTSTTPGAGTTCDSPSATPLTANTLALSLAWSWAGFSGSEATPAGYGLIQQTAFLGNCQAQKQLSTTAAENPVAWGALGSSTAIWANTVILASVAVGGPSITSQPSNAQVASGATANFSVTASASGGGSLSYQWKLNGTNVSTGSGGTTSSYTTGTLGYSDDGGLYSCDVTETGGSSPGTTTSSTATITVGTLVVGANTPVYSASAGTTVAPSYSTLPAIQANDEIVLIVAQKPSAANGGTVTTPTGYTLQGSLTGAGGYGATLGNNTGNTNLFVYTKNSVSGTETGTLTVTVGTNGVCGAVFVLLRPIAGSAISYAFASGSDSTAGNVSITCGSDPGETAGDIALHVFGGSSNLILPFSAQALTTTGITYGTVSEVVEYGTTVGNDVAGYVAVAKAQSGTSSAAPVFTATVGGTTTNARGPGVLLRMRAASSGVTVPTFGGFTRALGGGGAAIALLVGAAGAAKPTAGGRNAASLLHAAVGEYALARGRSSGTNFALIGAGESALARGGVTADALTQSANGGRSLCFGGATAENVFSAPAGARAGAQGRSAVSAFALLGPGSRAQSFGGGNVAHSYIAASAGGGGRASGGSLGAWLTVATAGSFSGARGGPEVAAAVSALQIVAFGGRSLTRGSSLTSAILGLAPAGAGARGIGSPTIETISTVAFGAQSVPRGGAEVFALALRPAGAQARSAGGSVAAPKLSLSPAGAAPLARGSSPASFIGVSAAGAQARAAGASFIAGDATFLRVVAAGAGPRAAGGHELALLGVIPGSAEIVITLKGDGTFTIITLGDAADIVTTTLGDSDIYFKPIS
jgi:hypothetical protein